MPGILMRLLESDEFQEYLKKAQEADMPDKPYDGGPWSSLSLNKNNQLVHSREGGMMGGVRDMVADAIARDNPLPETVGDKAKVYAQLAGDVLNLIRPSFDAGPDHLRREKDLLSGKRKEDLKGQYAEKRHQEQKKHVRETGKTVPRGGSAFNFWRER